jgi:hypothetical protein
LQRRRRDQRPQQQAAEVVRLAQVADGSPWQARSRDPNSVDSARREDLNATDAGADYAGAEHSGAGRPHQRRRLPAPMRRRAGAEHDRDSAEHAKRRQRQALVPCKLKPCHYHNDAKCDPGGDHRGRHRPRRRGGSGDGNEREHRPTDERGRLIEQGRRRREVVGEQ